MLSPDELKKCHNCTQMLPLSRFGTHVFRGAEKVYAKCIECRPKVAKSNKKYDESDKGIAANKKYKESDKGIAANKKYNESDKSIAKEKRAKKSEAGVARRKREEKVVSLRRKLDPAFRLYLCLGTSACHLVSGRTKSSPTFLQHTSFASVKAFLDHVEESTRKLGCTMAEYGEKWVIEHAIPQEAFDFSNPEDVKRCWSTANVRAFGPKENDKKGVKIIDELCMEIGAAHFPAAWNGQIPTETEKQALYAKWKTPWVPPTEASSSAAHQPTYESSMGSIMESSDEFSD